MELNTFLFTVVHQGAGQYLLLDRFFVILTSYVAYAVIASVLVYFLCIIPLRTSEPVERLRRLAQGAELALSLFITWAVVWALKVLIAHPRPFVVLADAMPLVQAAPLESFPSSHAALTMAAAIAVLPFQRHTAHLLIAFSLVVALSRLYVGVHYPLDIGAGLLIGFLIPKLIHRVFKK